MKLILAAISLFMGVFLLRKRIELNKKIDTESLAEVIEIIPLGIADFQRAYAIKYKVHSSTPFELLVSPTNKKEKIGKTKTVYYEEENPKENFYFKTFFSFDRRFFGPLCFIAFSVILAISFFVGL